MTDDNTIKFIELISNQRENNAKVTEILSNIRDIINKLPQINDINEIKRQVNELEDNFDEFAKVVDSINSNIKMRLEPFDKIVKLNEKFDEQNKQKIKEISKGYEILCRLNSINDNLGVLLEKEFGEHDIKTILDSSKWIQNNKDNLQQTFDLVDKTNQKLEKWTLRKKIIASSIGLILLLLLYSDKIILIGKWLEGIKMP